MTRRHKSIVRSAAVFALSLSLLWPAGPSDARADVGEINNRLDYREIQSGERDDFEDAEQVCLRDDFSALPETESLAPGTGGTALMVGAKEAPPCAFVGLAKIQFDKPGKPDLVCSGYFIGSNLVLTAAHCTCGLIRTYRIHRAFINQLGSEPKLDIDEYVLAGPPSRYAQYSCDVSTELQTGRDLALLPVRASERVDFSVNPEPNPNAHPLLESTTGGSSSHYTLIASMFEVQNDEQTRRLVSAGFGRDDAGEIGNLLYAGIPIASYYCGAGKFRSSSCASFREFVLADPRSPQGENRPDSCGGDSGGPVFWQAPRPPGAINKDRARIAPVYLVGVTSRAVSGVRHNPGTTCGGGGIYTALAHPDVVDWLAANGIRAYSNIGVPYRTEDE